MAGEIQAEIRRIVDEMRSQRPRYKSHDLGFVDSVSASRVDEWADELEALLALPGIVPTPPLETIPLELVDAFERATTGWRCLRCGVVLRATSLWRPNTAGAKSHLRFHDRERPVAAPPPSEE